MGWSQTGADRMSKLRCYERNYGRDGIINLVKYSRENRGIDTASLTNVTPEKFTLRDIISEHYDQAKSYIDRIQVHVPEGTVRKTASIRLHQLLF
jgi:hypothetical protein